MLGKLVELSSQLNELGQHGLLTLTIDFDFDYGRPSLNLRAFCVFQDFD